MKVYILLFGYFHVWEKIGIKLVKYTVNHWERWKIKKKWPRSTHRTFFLFVAAAESPHTLCWNVLNLSEPTALVNSVNFKLYQAVSGVWSLLITKPVRRIAASQSREPENQFSKRQLTATTTRWRWRTVPGGRWSLGTVRSMRPRWSQRITNSS